MMDIVSRIAHRARRIGSLGALGILAAPSFAFALSAPKNFKEFADLLVALMGTATAVVMIFGFVMYLWGMATNIPHLGDEKGAEKRKSFFFWGIIVLFVMVSIWGIVQLLQSTLFGDSLYGPSGPGETPFDELRSA